MNHGEISFRAFLTSSFTHRSHPFRRFPGIEPEMFLQSFHSLQGSEPGLVRGIRLENREQTAGLFGQFRRSFCHHFAVVNLDFQCEITHATSITAPAPLANKISTLLLSLQLRARFPFSAPSCRHSRTCGGGVGANPSARRSSPSSSASPCHAR